MRRYIADLHFYHSSLLDHMDCRGFSSVEEMNEYMIEQWNSVVRPNDETVVLGDFSIGKAEETSEIFRRLHGKIYLVRGNHDRFLDDKEFKAPRLVWVKDYAEMSDNKRKVVLSHYPIMFYNGQYRRDDKGIPKTYMLHGHIHNTMDQKLLNSFIQQTRETQVLAAHQTEPHPIPCQMINCFCMFSDYKPLTLDEWIALNRD